MVPPHVAGRVPAELSAALVERLAVPGGVGTVRRGMQDREAAARLLTTPFFGSWIGKARPGEKTSSDPQTRTAAWAHWAVENAVEMTGSTGRSYPALLLPGRFYDPKGIGPKLRPHLEIPSRVLKREDPSFPARLALMGNALLFNFWLPGEVTAARRALFGQGADPSEVFDLLWSAWKELRATVSRLLDRVGPSWHVVEELMVTSDPALTEAATGDFGRDEVEGFFPSAAGFSLEVRFDRRLREESGVWAARRVGVWQVSGSSGTGRFSFGVLTPRLTANSMFRDELFLPERESPASLLVRGLVLSRVGSAVLDHDAGVTVPAPESGKRPGYFLRAVPARVGAALPEASLSAAVKYLQAYPDAEEAWKALEDWATRTGSLLTVTRDGYLAAHRRARRFVSRAEDPEREDIDVILPLAWDRKSRVVRVTFVSTVDRDG